jgi:hypothetical protein
VEALQSVELTGTNRSEILIANTLMRFAPGSSSLRSFPGAIG